MEKFTGIELRLSKDVKKGNKESLIASFSFQERLKRMEILKEIDEGQSVRVILERVW